MTVHVQAPGWWKPREVMIRATMAILDHFDIRYVTVYVDRRNKPAWTAQIGWL